MMVDCHTHWGRAFTQRDGEGPTNWLAVLDRHQVTHAVVLPHEGLVHAGRVREDNDRVARVCAASDGRMIPFCTVHTAYRDEALNEAERCLKEAGHRGMKFHPWLQGISPSDPAMDELCELAAGHDAPMLFHDGTPPFSLPAQIAVLARRHPQARIVLGHGGLLEHWREAVEAMRFAPNLWLCLCGPHAAGMDHIVRHVDPQRLVWGTDFGFGLADSYSYRLPLFNQTPGLSEPLRRAMLNDNPRRLLGL